MLKWDLDQECETCWCLRAIVGQWVMKYNVWLHDLKNLQKGIVEHMPGVLGRYLD